MDADLLLNLESDQSLYQPEKRFIATIRRGVTEQLVDRIFQWRPTSAV